MDFSICSVKPHLEFDAQVLCDLNFKYKELIQGALQKVEKCHCDS